MNCRFAAAPLAKMFQLRRLPNTTKQGLSRFSLLYTSGCSFSTASCVCGMSVRACASYVCAEYQGGVTGPNGKQQVLHGVL